MSIPLRLGGYIWSTFISQWPTIQNHAETAFQRLRDSELSEIVRDFSSFSLRMFLRFMQLTTAFFLLLTSSSAIYACFYYLIMPSKVLQRPLYFDYGVHSLLLHDKEHINYYGNNTLIQLPLAILDLSTGKDGRDQWNYLDQRQGDEIFIPLTSNAKYDFLIDFELAQTNTNIDIGMFMIRTHVYSNDICTAKSARPTFLRPGHWIIELTSRFLWIFPTLIFGHDGSLTQKENILAINGYTDIRTRQVTSVRIELSHPRVQIVHASLSIIAQLSGLRYFMYHWFALTCTLAILHISFCQIFCCFVFYLYLTFPSMDTSMEEQHGQVEEDAVSFDAQDLVNLDHEEENEEELPPIVENELFTAEATAHLRQRMPRNAAKAI